MTRVAAEAAPPSCESCAGARVLSRGKYGGWGWFALIMGVSVLPKYVEYYCGQCGRVIGRTTDDAVREAHR